jgi:hypothetical protein
MNGVYKSLKVKMHDTFQTGKASPAPAAPNKSSNDLTFNHEMEQLESAVAEGLGKLKAAVKQGEATMAAEIRRAEQVIGTLGGDVAALEAKLKEAEEAVRQKDSSRQQIEETLKSKIHELQNEVKGKEQQLAAQAKEFNDFRSNFDAKVKQVNELESANAKAKQEAASHAKRAADLAGISQAKIEQLESQLKEKDELARQKDSSIQKLEQAHAAKIQDFDNLAKNKQELLAARDAVIGDLKSQLRLLTKGIGEMSSFFKQAQAFAVVERQDAGPTSPSAAVHNSEEKTIRSANSTKAASTDKEKLDDIRSNPTAVPFAQEKKPAVIQLEGVTGVGSNDIGAPAESKPAAAQPNGNTTALNRSGGAEVVPPEVFERLSGELAEVAGVMSPLATLIVREHAENLGESIEKFPKIRLPELIDSLSRELLDEKRQVDFRARLVNLEPSTRSRQP